MIVAVLEVKLYVQKPMVDLVWPMGRSLLAPALEDEP